MRFRQMQKWLKSGRRGNAFLLMLPFIIFMIIFAWALIRRSSAAHTQSFHIHRKNVALYVAEGVLAVADNWVRKEIDLSMKKDFIEGNIKSYNLYDKSKLVKEQVDDLLATYENVQLDKLLINLEDVGKFKGATSGDDIDKKESYATLVFTAEVTYFDTTMRLDITRDIKIVNITPPGNDYTFWGMKNCVPPESINDGQVIICVNNEQDSNDKGKIRLEGEYTIQLGTKDYYSLVHGPTNMPKSLLPQPWAVANSHKTSIGQPLADPGFAYDGINKMVNVENGKAKEHGKIRLFGSFLRTKRWSTQPVKVEGAIKKKFLKVPYKLSFVTPGIPATPSSPEIPPTYHYTLDHDAAEVIVEEYRSMGGLEGINSPVSHLMSSPSGAGMKKADEYKARATTFTEKLQMRNFSHKDLTYIQGIHYANHLVVGDEQTTISYCGKSLIVSDNTMKIYNGLTMSDDKEWKDKSSMGLIFLSRKVPNQPFEFYKSRNVKQVHLDACLYSRNGIQYVGDGSPVWRRIYIHGNYVSPNLNMEVWKQGYIYVFYNDRLKDKEEEKLVAIMSPVLSSFRLESAKAVEK